MKAPLSILYLLIPIALFIGACNNKQSSSNNNNQEDFNSDYSIADSSYKIISETWHSDYFVGRELQDSTVVKASYPKFQQQWINALINEHFFENAEPEHLANGFILGFDEFVEDMGVENVRFPWMLSREVNIAGNLGQVLVLKNKFYEFTGCAHGNYYSQYLNIDMHNQQAIALKDLIQHGKQPTLLETAEQLFRDQEGLTANEPFGEGYFFHDGQFSLPETFHFESDALVFTYHVYAIKPYSEGETELKIPFKEIQQVLTDYALELIDTF